jgi:hypothetical protein
MTSMSAVEVTRQSVDCSLLETGGPNNTGDVALYTKTRQMSSPLNVAKALAET